MRYFIDWEFHDDGETIEPISLGIVAEDGRELYIELLFNTERVADDEWMMANVVPHLRHVKYDGTWVCDVASSHTERSACAAILDFVDDEPEFWAYYADYDWVVTCHLFGTMMELPKTFPKICLDLQQWWIQLGKPEGVKPPDPTDAHHALADARWNRDLFHALTEYDRTHFLRVPSSPRCSFCGKDQEAVAKLIAGDKVWVCNECVELSRDILGVSRLPKRRRASLPPIEGCMLIAEQDEVDPEQRMGHEDCVACTADPSKWCQTCVEVEVAALR